MFEDAILFTMKYEVGPWFKLDLETEAGLCDTPARKRKTGYVNDPHDMGGETKFGIAQKSHPALDIKTMNWQQAKAIYEAQYWLPLSPHKLPEKVALVLFDCAVHHGVSRAIKFLQEAVSATPDGVLGPKTFGLVGSTPEFEVIALVLSRRRKFMKQIVINKPMQGRFLDGWLSRVDSLEKAFV